MRWVIVAILMVFLCHGGYTIGYEKGRVDKHAEIMEYISGDRLARVSVWTHDKRTQYHKAGTCAACHTEG